MSLGLRTLVAFEGTRLAELGCRVAESVAGNGNELMRQVSGGLSRYESDGLTQLLLQAR